MTLRYKICLFAVKLFEDHGIKVDCAEVVSLSIYLVYDPGSNKHRPLEIIEEPNMLNRGQTELKSVKCHLNCCFIYFNELSINLNLNPWVSL